MELFAKKDKRTELRKEYDEAVKLLKTFVPGTKDYMDQLEIVERIHTILMNEEDHKKKVSPDAVVNGTVGLLQIGAILWHEQFHNITTKAIGFVTKGRVR